MELNKLNEANDLLVKALDILDKVSMELIDDKEHSFAIRLHNTWYELDRIEQNLTKIEIDYLEYKYYKMKSENKNK